MSPVQVVDVEDLGQPAMIVRKSPGPELLLLDTGLTHDQRIRILQGFFPTTEDGD